MLRVARSLQTKIAELKPSVVSSWVVNNDCTHPSPSYSTEGLEFQTHPGDDQPVWKYVVTLLMSDRLAMLHILSYLTTRHLDTQHIPTRPPNGSETPRAEEQRSRNPQRRFSLFPGSTSLDPPNV